MNMEYLVSQLIYMPRIFLALACGIALGYERKRQMKTAGVTTHAMVAGASALMMIVSKYGFFDVIGFDSVQLDPSRIAAGVVTAISFLGAGVIFNRKMNISGLTTAAGLWMTVGIGAAMGSGMYAAGILCTAVVLLMQAVAHWRHSLYKPHVMECVELTVEEYRDLPPILEKISGNRKCMITNMSITRQSDRHIKVKIYASHANDFSLKNTIEFMESITEITSVKY